MLSRKQKAVAEYIAQYPFESKKEVAEKFGVHYNTVYNWIKLNAEFQEYMEECANQAFKQSAIGARKMMEALMERGNYRATEFILRANGINPVERVESVNNDIHITIDDEE